MTMIQRAPRPGPKKLAAAILSGLLSFPPGSIPLLWAADEPSLDAIKVAGDRVQINLSAQSQYTSRVTATPPRLIVDITGAQYKAPAKSFAAAGRYLKGVRASQYKPAPELVSRVVMDLNKMTGYEITKNDGGLLIALGPAVDAAKPRLLNMVTGSLDKPAAEAGGMSTQMSQEVSDMAAKTDASDNASDNGASAPAAPRPADSTQSKAVNHTDIMSGLPHDLVSLDFDNTDIKDVIKLLAAKAKINIIYGPDVDGNLTLHLNDVPFDEAFRTILTMMSLSTSQVGENILRVLTPQALVKSQTAAATATKVLTLNYSKAADLLPTVNAVRTAEGRSGTALADAKTNSLIITESIEGLARTELLISQLDQKPKQVLIEAKLVEVNLNNSLSFGVQWDYASLDHSVMGGQQGVNTNGGTLAPGTLPIVPVAQASPAPAGQVGAAALDQGYNFTPGGGATGRGTGVNLPASQIFGALTLGRVTNNYFLNMTLTAAASQGKVKVLSDPKVATLNNQPANINVTTQVPYVTSNATANTVSTAVSYVTIGIQMSVTPTVNADGRVTLVINPVVSQPAASVAGGSSAAPTVNSRNATTTVLVRDGETIVIGGLISDSVQDSISKIPILGDIPILGWLFKTKTTSRSRTELLIFVTTKILAD